MLGVVGGLAEDRDLEALTCGLLSKLSKPVSTRGSLTSSQKIFEYFLLVSQRALGAIRIQCKLVIGNHEVYHGYQRKLLWLVSNFTFMMMESFRVRYLTLKLLFDPTKFFNLHLSSSAKVSSLAELL